MKVESVRCIQGGMRKRWCVLDTQDVMGRECVSIGSTKQWLHTVLAGQVFGSTYYHAINNFVAECFDAAKRAKKGEAVKSVKAPPVPVQDEQNSGAASGQVVASSQAAKKGRAAIFGAAEDDSDDNLRAIVPRKQGRKGIRMRAAMGWAPITVRNITFVCTCRRGRQLLVPTGTYDLDRIVQHLLPRNGEEPRLTSDDFKDILSDDDENRISWRISRSTRRAASSQGGCVDTPVGHWVVHYTDKDGKDCESCVGLGVPRSSLIGEPLTEEQKMEAARQVLMRARRDWNSLDCSGEDRLQV